jgi:hypothetical protein
MLLTLQVFSPHIQAENKKETLFSPAVFNQVQDVLCKENQESADDPCSYQYKDFFIDTIDLNGDKKPEYLFYGPSSECGVHGNCPLLILQKNAEKWRVLYSGWGSTTYRTKPLNKLHQGYQDLEVSSDLGAFYWVKDIWFWNGVKYELQPNSTTYYIYDDESEKLVPVSKKQWDDRYNYKN